MVILVVSLVFSSGCLNYEIPAGPSGPEEITPVVTAAPTAAAGELLQQGTTKGETEILFESQGYIQRPWGYAAAEREPSHTLSVPSPVWNQTMKAGSIYRTPEKRSEYAN